MSQDNIEIVKVLMDAVDRRDIDAYAGVTTPDFEWLPVFAARVERDVYRGREGIEKFLGEVDETWAEFRPMPEEYRDLGDRVLALGRLKTRGRASGVPNDSPWAGIYDVRNGKIARIRTYLDHDEAFRATNLGASTQASGPRSEHGLRDTGPAMSGQSATRDPVELVRRQIDAANRRDLDAFMRLCPPDGVYDTSPSGLGVYEGSTAIRAFIQEWWDAFEELTFELEEILDLGNGVTFVVIRHDGRPTGSVGQVQTRQASVIEWVAGMAARLTVYTDIDEGRAAAERLAEERG